MCRVRRAQYALYQLGYSGQLLTVLADDYWFAAHQDSPLPGQHGNLVGEIQEFGRHALENLTDDDRQLSAHIRQLVESGVVGWAAYSESWLNEDHRRVICRLEALAEVSEEPSDDWWEASSPLASCPLGQVNASIDQLHESLPPEFSCCISAGKLVAQIRALPFNHSEQTDNRLQRFPIASLRQRLLDLQQSIPSLQELQYELPEAFAPMAGMSHSEYCKMMVAQIHRQIVSHFVGLMQSEQNLDQSTHSQISLVEPNRSTPHSNPLEVGSHDEGATPEQELTENANRDQSSDDDQRPNSGQAHRLLREPLPHAIQAYRLSFMLGRTQQAIADLMTCELGRPVCQGMVSRWLAAVREYVQAGGILPNSANLPPTQHHNREIPVDPSTIDLGARQDRRRPRPSDLNDD